MKEGLQVHGRKFRTQTSKQKKHNFTITGIFWSFFLNKVRKGLMSLDELVKIAMADVCCAVSDGNGGNGSSQNAVYGYTGNSPPIEEPIAITAQAVNSHTVLNRLLKNFMCCLFAVSLLLTAGTLASCRKPEDKIITYGAKTDGKAVKENVKSALNDKDVKSVTIKSEENFNQSLAPEMSEHAKVLTEIIRLGQIKTAGTINALEITRGALDSLKALGFNATGTIIEIPNPAKDTVLLFSAVKDISMATLNALIGDDKIRDIIIRSAADFQNKGVAEMVVHTSKAKAIADVGGKIRFDKTSIVNPYKIHPTQQAELEAFFKVVPLTEFYRDTVLMFTSGPMPWADEAVLNALDNNEEIRKIKIESAADFHGTPGVALPIYLNLIKTVVNDYAKTETVRESIFNPPEGEMTPADIAEMSNYFTVIPGYKPGKSKGFKNNAINQRGYSLGGRGS